MKIVDNRVNTNAWMKLIRVSSTSMNSDRATEITAVPAPTAVPNIWANTMINNINTITTMWPPSMLAKRRTMSASGLVKIPRNSINGIMGTGHLSAMGTSGQKMSFQ